MIKTVKKEKKPEEFVEGETETKKYKGIEYSLVQFKLKGTKDKGKDSVNKNIWYDCQDPKKVFERCMPFGFLNFNTRGMVDARLKDKKHQAELVAMSSINEMLGGVFSSRLKFIWKEIKLFIILESKIWLKQILFKLKKSID